MLAGAGRLLHGAHVDVRQLAGFQYVGPGDQMLIMRLGSKCFLPAEPSC